MRQGFQFHRRLPFVGIDVAHSQQGGGGFHVGEKGLAGEAVAGGCVGVGAVDGEEAHGAGFGGLEVLGDVEGASGVGDEDGVIVIPRRDAERVLLEAQAFQKSDTAKLRAAIDGTADRSWVRKQLDAKKCEFLDEAY